MRTWLKHVWQKKWVRGVSYATLVIVFAGVLLFSWANYAVNACSDAIFHDVNLVPSHEYGLVLGTVKYLQNGKINGYYQSRMVAAADLYHAGKIQKIIVSGDNGRRAYNETQDMRESLIALGVPAEAILSDYAGFRTLDSMLRARNVFGIERFVVVSQDFHCRRAIYIARHHGLEVVGYAAEDMNRREQLRRMTREPLARFLAFLDVNLLNTQPHFEK